MAEINLLLVSFALNNNGNPLEMIDRLTDNENHLALWKLLKILKIKERCDHIRDFLKRHDTSIHKNVFFAEICLQHEVYYLTKSR